MNSIDHVRIPARVLEILAAAVGTPLTLDAASEAAGVAHQVDWTLALAHSARRGGLKVAHFRIETWMELARLATLGTPSVTRIGDRWVLVLGTNSGGLNVVTLDALGERRQTMSHFVLFDWLLAHDSKLPMSWVAIEARMMLASTEHVQNHYRRLLRFWNLERHDITVALVFGCAMAVTSLAVPIAAQALVNIVAATAMVQPLVMLGIMLLIALVAVGILQTMQIVVVERIHQRLWVRTASDWLRRLPRYSREARQRVSTHELANRFFDVCLLQKDTVSLLLDGTSLVLTTGASLVLLAFYHPWLLVFDVVLVVGIIGVIATGWHAGSRADEESFSKYDLFAWIDDVAGGRLLFASARGRAFADARGELLLRKWLAARRLYFKSILRQITSGIALQVIATVGLLTLGGYLVIERQLTFGQLVAASVLVTVIGSGLTRLGRQLDPIYEAAAVAATFAKNLDEKLEQEGGLLLPPRDEGLAVELRDRNTGKVVVAVEPGQRLGLIGGTGSHSRLLDLLYGLYGTQRLEAIDALLDGIETHVLDPESLRGQVALVRGQEIVWAKVRENLDLGLGSDDKELLELLELVYLRERLLGLPQGLDTLLIGDSDGGPLEESELRRIVLVRALLAKPRLLLLDRGLDGLGLDAQQRGRLFDWLFDRGRPWTLIVSTGSQECAEVLGRCDNRIEIPKLSNPQEVKP
jgi:ABC-type bacteriocin/lantibiotic exporter with double-glycine peptidase domain